MTNITINCKSGSGKGLSELLVSISELNNMEVNIVDDSGVFLQNHCESIEIDEAKELGFMIDLLRRESGSGNIVSSGGSVIDCFLTSEASDFLQSNKAYFENSQFTVN